MLMTGKQTARSKALNQAHKLLDISGKS